MDGWKEGRGWKEGGREVGKEAGSDEKGMDRRRRDGGRELGRGVVL